MLPLCGADGGLFQSTPPVRGATFEPVLSVCRLGISIHAPRAGGDSGFYNMDCMDGIFQSTPPVRGATDCMGVHYSEEEISIHAPRAGGDRWQRTRAYILRLFQSTPPVRGATGVFTLEDK